ncbi:hypothetical protein ATCC90586_011499 [Pythium insidiosum]|nr:hypothetical protein ATCC90586_011499 [Pythium insidiosum]
MDHETSRLVSASREFVEELRCFSSWNTADVETLTFWFDSVFEAYRSATEVDSRQGTQTRGTVRAKLSLQDPDLQSVLYVIQSERFAALAPSTQRPSGNDRTVQLEQQRRLPRQDPNRSSAQQRTRSKTPQDVLDALPRRGRLTACMNLAEGQQAGTYLVVDTSAALRWKRLRYSPFGCVPKKDVDPSVEARLIHDLSFPTGLSVNARSIPCQFPLLLFDSVRRLASRIEELATRFPGCTAKILKGDIKGAFRHVPVAASLAAHFAGSYQQGLTVIDLSLPFGWTGSPAHYGAFGGAVSYLVARESPRSLDPSSSDDTTFFPFVWVDDHVLIEPDIGNRLELAEVALRLGMLAVLGPNAINEKKFSSWETSLQALGLTWDTALRTVSMPPDKIAKATLRIAHAISSREVTKHQLAKLLGSLRHVSICCRATRAFFQRLHGTWQRAPPIGVVRLSADEIEDLLWIDTLLRRGGTTSVPTSVLADTLNPAVHLFMDASDEGLCVLYPSTREYLRLRFDDEERAAITLDSTDRCFSINVRETLSAVLAVLVWGPRWRHHGQYHRPVHVRCWIDNMSAVSWIRRHHSRNTYGQELTRVLSCAELEFHLLVSTAHLAGARNKLADLGSRGWSGSR